LDEDYRSVPGSFRQNHAAVAKKARREPLWLDHMVVTQSTPINCASTGGCPASETRMRWNPRSQRPEKSGSGLVRQRHRRYIRGMKLALDLPPAQAERLQAEADRLGLSPEDLARAVLADLLAAPDSDFERLAKRIISKNEELYKRLA
jgi:hypothetical protein